MAEETTDKKSVNVHVNKAESTQRYLDVWEIRDDVVILREGTLRAIVLVSSVNFALKSEDEQAAVIQAYTQFLNSIDFTLQVVVQSRKLVIDDYLDRLKQREKEQTNELLKMQTQEYIQYVQELVSLADIMTKRFYVVVPYAPGKSRRQGFFSRLFGLFSPTSVIQIKEKKFFEYRQEIMKRVDFAVDGLSSVGLKAVPLDTQSLIELYYNTYNPETSAQEKLTDVSKLNVEASTPKS